MYRLEQNKYLLRIIMHIVEIGQAIFIIQHSDSQKRAEKHGQSMEPYIDNHYKII